MQIRDLKTWGGNNGWALLGALLLAGCGGGGSDGVPEEFETAAACIDPAVLQDGASLDMRYLEAMTERGSSAPDYEEYRVRFHNTRRLLEIEGATTVRPVEAILQTVTVDVGGERFEAERAWQQRPNGVLDWYLLNGSPVVAGTRLQNPDTVVPFTRPCEDRLWTLRQGEEARFACTTLAPTVLGTSNEVERTSRYTGLQRVATPAGRFDACVFHESEQTYAPRYGYRTSTERIRWVVRGIDVRVEEDVTDNDGDAYRSVLELQAATINGQPLVP